MAGGRFNLGAQIKGTIPTYDGAAFVGSWDGRFYRLDLADGSEEWSFDTGDVVMSNPAIDPDRGVVYVGSDSHYVYALEAATGDELWSTDVDGHVIGSITAHGRNDTRRLLRHPPVRTRQRNRKPALASRKPRP